MTVAAFSYTVRLMAKLIADTIHGTKSINLESLTPAQWRELFGSGNGANRSAVELASLVGWLYRCVNLRANSLASVPWEIQAISSGNAIIDSESEEWDALPWASAIPELLWLTEASLSLVGVAYWHRLRNVGRRPVGLRWFAPNTISEVWDAREGLVSYRRSANSDIRIIPAQDIIRTALPNAMHETQWGTPPAQAAMIDAGVIYNANVFAEAFFDRGAIKAMLLTVDGNPPKQEMERLESWWRRFFSGAKDAYQTAAVRAGVTPVIVGEGLESLSNAQLTMERREGISTAMGVPHSMVLSNAANFAVSESDRLNFYDTTIVPQAKLVQRQVNRQLFEPLGFRLVFKWQELAVYQQSEADRATAFKLYVDAGIKKSIAAEMAGLFLPENVEYTDLDDEPEPLTITMPQPQPPQLADNATTDGDETGDMEESEDDAERQAEAKRFRVWAKKRIGREGFDPHAFKTDLLDDADIHAILATMTDEAQGSETPAPFPADVDAWDTYP